MENPSVFLATYQWGLNELQKKQQGTSPLGDQASGSAMLGKAEGTAGSSHVSLLLSDSTEAGQPGYTVELTHLFYATKHQHFGGTCLATLATLKHGLNWSLSPFPHQFFLRDCFSSWFYLTLLLPSWCSYLAWSLWELGQLSLHPVWHLGLASPTSAPERQACGGDVWWIHVYEHFEFLLIGSL